MLPGTNRFLAPTRSVISRRKRFGTPMLERGLAWYEWQELYDNKLRTPLTITFGFIATHNQFVLVRGGKVFNRTAPVIKLPAAATEEEHLGLLGLLNASTACFWLKQVGHNRGDSTDNKGARTTGDVAFNTYEFTSTQLDPFPLPAGRPLDRARELDRYAQTLQALSPAALSADATKLTREGLEEASGQWHRILARMIALQEDLDWEVYALYGLTPEPLTPSDLDAVPLALGQRAFEIALARKIAAGEEQSEWFARHGSTPITEIPAEWPAPYSTLVERRLRLIATDKSIGLIERPEYKRRWNVTPWAEQLTAALRTWLLDRLETLSHSAAEPALFSVSELAERTRADADFQRVAGLYTGRPDYDLTALVAELVAKENAPSLPGQRYKDTGLRKRAQWEETWTKQRAEDAITARLTKAGLTGDALKQAIHTAVKTEIGDIPVPPKYASADFLKSSFWKLRGKLDVPKERWISYPGAERTVDPTLVLAWAGWTHLQQAQALAAHYERLRSDGASESQLGKLLASLQELIPWLLQWHNEIDPAYGERMGDFFKTFVEEESRRLHLTPADLSRIAGMRA